MFKLQNAKLLKSSFGSLTALLLNLILVFLLYIVARLAFLFENYSYFSEGLSVSRLSTMFWGGYIFDRSAIAYTNILYIVLMLLPLWLKENKAYHLVCKWVFVVVNTFSFVLNLCDAVYFPYTLRRTTTSVFREFSNEHNLVDVFAGEILVHWYLVVLTILVVFLLWKL